MNWTGTEMDGSVRFYEITKSMSATDQKYIGKFCRSSTACLKLWVDYLKVRSGGVILER